MRYDDHSNYTEKWTNAKLIARLRETANLRTFGSVHRDLAADKIRAETALYRDTWMNPVLDEIAKRLIKPKRKKP